MFLHLAVQFSRYIPRIDPWKRYRFRRTNSYPTSLFDWIFLSPSVFGFAFRQSIDLESSLRISASALLPRKEVIQPHLPIRLPCYDFTPVIGLTFDSCLLAVSSLASGAPNSHGVTGGVYKARERIHRDMLIRDY